MTVTYVPDPRPAATIEELGRAYRAFLGDADARTRTRPVLLAVLIHPYQAGAFVPFARFVDLNRTSVEVIEPPRLGELDFSSADGEVICRA